MAEGPKGFRVLKGFKAQAEEPKETKVFPAWLGRKECRASQGFKGT